MKSNMFLIRQKISIIFKSRVAIQIEGEFILMQSQSKNQSQNGKSRRKLLMVSALSNQLMVLMIKNMIFCGLETTQQLQKESIKVISHVVVKSHQSRQKRSNSQQMLPATHVYFSLFGNIRKDRKRTNSFIALILKSQEAKLKIVQANA